MSASTQDSANSRPSKRPRLSDEATNHFLAQLLVQGGFGDGLLEDFAYGRSSGVQVWFHDHIVRAESMSAQVRSTAARALAWCEGCGGQPSKHDLVRKITKAGSSGLHQQNIERDLHNMMRNMEDGGIFKTKIATVLVRKYDFVTGEVIWKDTQVIMPDDFLVAIWNQGQDVWRHFLTGSASPAEFWARVEQSSPWFQHHPARHRDKRRLIPISFYGDDVQAFKNTEAGVVTCLGFGSDLSFTNPPLERYLPLGVYAAQTAADETFEDILTHLVPRFQRLVSEDAQYPWSPYGWSFAYSSTQGDLKWITDNFHFHNYRANSFCSRCPCEKSNNNIGLTLGNFNHDAEHLQTRYTQEDYLQWSSPEERCFAWKVCAFGPKRWFRSCAPRFVLTRSSWGSSGTLRARLLPWAAVGNRPRNQWQRFVLPP